MGFHQNSWDDFFEDTSTESKWTQGDWNEFLQYFLDECPNYNFEEVITKFVKDGLNINNMFEDIFKALIAYPRFADEFLGDFEFFKDQITQLDGFKFFNVDIDLEIQENAPHYCFEDYVWGCGFAAKLISMFWDKLSDEFRESLFEHTEILDVEDILSEHKCKFKYWWEHKGCVKLPSLIESMYWKHLKLCVPQLYEKVSEDEEIMEISCF